MKKIIKLVNIFCCILIVGNIQAQKINLREFAAVKNVDPSGKATPGNIDKNLVITGPLLGKQVNGKIKITGKATPNSKVKIEVTASYYKYKTDYKSRKISKGDGPFEDVVKYIILKANGAGMWSTTPVNFNNYGYSTIFKIVARSVVGKNATYVTVENNKLPNIAWD